MTIIATFHQQGRGRASGYAAAWRKRFNGTCASADGAQSSPPHHDMSAMPAHWMGKEQIAFLIYPEFTALDMVGPHYMMTSLMGATVHVVAKTKDPVKSDTGLVFIPSATFEECPQGSGHHLRAGRDSRHTRGDAGRCDASLS